MNNVKIEMASGNFQLAAEIQLKPEVQSDLIQKGLKYELERSVLSATYIALAGVPGKRNGSKVLPEGFKRESIQFNEGNAEAFKKALQAGLDKLGTVGSLAVGVYVPGEGSEPKFKDEKAAMSRHESMTGEDPAKPREQELEFWMRNTVGYAGAIWTEDEEDFHPAALAAVRVYAKGI
jgi:hypothetical protein